MKIAAKTAVLLPVVLAVVGYASFGRAQDRKEAAPAAAPGGASAASSAAAAKSAADLPPANPKDVESLDAIVTAVYEVISGPPGPRDWNRFNSLFAADARLIAVRTPKDGGKPSLVVMTPKGYEERAGKHFLEHGFFEHEIGRKTDSFGAMTHIYTTYESRETKDGKAIDRGINSMEFFYDGTRWWCVEIYWDSERPGNPIPEKYLGK